MSANTETTGADRTGCKAWCGTYAKHSPTYNRFWDSRLRCSGDHAPVHWCSHDCREQRLPPIAAPAATPEPAECGYPIGSDQNPCNLNKGHLGRHSLNRVVVAPPAQEAPKAAPVCCTKDKESTVCDGSLLKRIICRDVPPILMCDAHWMLRESRMIEGVKAPYDGPERLSKSQLAADWVDDCLPESDR